MGLQVPQGDTDTLDNKEEKKTENEILVLIIAHDNLKLSNTQTQSIISYALFC